MIHINSPEDFQKWLLEGARRSKLYSGWTPPQEAKESNVERLPVVVEEFSKPFPPPIKESRDFTEAVDDGLDGIEP